MEPQIGVEPLFKAAVDATQQSIRVVTQAWLTGLQTLNAELQICQQACLQSALVLNDIGQASQRSFNQFLRTRWDAAVPEHVDAPPQDAN